MRDLTALSDKEELEEHIELYHGNPSLPVYTKNKQVLSPEHVTSLLMGVDNESKVCKVPPTAIANNVTFLVDLQGLKSENDVKCDDMGHWRNNSNKKFTFYVEWTDDFEAKIHTSQNSSEERQQVTLKRECYRLNNIGEDDLRKRIDWIYRKDETIILTRVTVLYIRFLIFPGYKCHQPNCIHVA